MDKTQPPACPDCHGTSEIERPIFGRNPWDTETVTEACDNPECRNGVTRCSICGEEDAAALDSDGNPACPDRLDACPSCDGSGSYSFHVSSESDSWAAGWDGEAPCEDCGGTGKVSPWSRPPACFVPEIVMGRHSSLAPIAEGPDRFRLEQRGPSGTLSVLVFERGNAKRALSALILAAGEVAERFADAEGYRIALLGPDEVICTIPKNAADLAAPCVLASTSTDTDDRR